MAVIKRENKDLASRNLLNYRKLILECRMKIGRPVRCRLQDSQSVFRAVSQSVSQSVTHSTSHPDSQSVSQSVSQPASQLNSQPAGRSASPSVCTPTRSRQSSFGFSPLVRLDGCWFFDWDFATAFPIIQSNWSSSLFFQFFQLQSPLSKLQSPMFRVKRHVNQTLYWYTLLRMELPVERMRQWYIGPRRCFAFPARYNINSPPTNYNEHQVQRTPGLMA